MTKNQFIDTSIHPLSQIVCEQGFTDQTVKESLSEPDPLLFAQTVDWCKKQMSELLQKYPKMKKMITKRTIESYLVEVLALPSHTIADIVYLLGEKKRSIYRWKQFLQSLSVEEQQNYLNELMQYYHQDDELYLFFAKKSLSLVPKNSQAYIIIAASLGLKYVDLGEYTRARFYLHQAWLYHEALYDVDGDFCVRALCAYSDLLMTMYAGETVGDDCVDLLYTIIADAEKAAVTLAEKAMVQYHKGVLYYMHNHEQQGLLDIRMSTTVMHPYYIDAQILSARAYIAEARYEKAYEHVLLPTIHTLNTLPENITFRIDQKCDLNYLSAKSNYEAGKYPAALIYYSNLAKIIDSFGEQSCRGTSEMIAEVYHRQMLLQTMKLHTSGLTYGLGDESDMSYYTTVFT